MTTFRLLIALSLTLAAPRALAQYVATPQAGVSYPSLTNPIPVPLAAPAMNEPKDRGRVTIPLGFSFPFYNSVYTQVTVTANGVLFFEPSSANNSAADFSGNFQIPNGSEPNGVVAPLWDDLDGTPRGGLNPNSALQSQALSGANGQGIAIEFRDWNRAFGNFSLTFQVRLWANGIIEFFYGPMTGSGATSITATIGIESPSGTAGTRAFAACNGDCDLTDFDPGGTGTPISYLRFGPPAGVDLQALALRIDGITTGGSTLTFDTSFTLRNFGTLPSGPFSYGLYLSEDTIFDQGLDVPMTPPAVGPLSLGALVVTTSSVTSTVARPDAGSWYVLAAIPPLPDGGEVNTFNNVLASSVPYAAGVDLIAQSVLPPPVVGPGENVTVDVQFSNQGFEVAGAVDVKLWASVDTQLTSDDLLLDQRSVVVGGGQQVQQGLTFTLAPATPADDYYVLLQLDDAPDAGALLEGNELNNLAVSATRMQVRQADLIVSAVRVQRSLPPFDEVNDVYFGDDVRLEAFVANVGGATAPNVRVSFFMSDNESLNAITDVLVGNVQNLAFAPGEARWVTLGPAAVPTQSNGGQPLAVQPYFFFAAAIGNGLREQDPTNNFDTSRPIVARLPAPNLVAVDMQAPARGAAGEIIAVSRTFANLGNRDAPPATYRYYLSANTIITPDDLPLLRVTSNGEVQDGTLTLQVDQRDSQVELIRLPGTLAPSSYFVGVLVDPDGALAEADEGDNGLAATRTEVVPQALSLANAVLPDGTLGQPYFARLEGVGGAASYSFTASTAAPLPAGLALTSAGVISGTPTQAGAWSVQLQVASGGRAVTVARTLRIARLTSSLALTTPVLPAPTRFVEYEGNLGASGGAGGYAFALSQGILPEGLSLDGALGRITGVPTEALGTSRTFVVRVTDGIGNIDERAFTMTVVDGQPFTIKTRQLPDALVGDSYVEDLLVVNPSGAPVSTPVTWRVISGAIPPGLAFEPSASDTLILTGQPTSAGRYRFTVEAVDAQGRTDQVTYLLTISSGTVSVSVTGPSLVLPGEEVSIAFSATPLPEGSRWWWRGGRLPPGLAFSADGLVSGAVPADAALGVYTFTVGAGVAPDNLVALTSRSLEVASERPVPPTCAAAVGLSPWLATLGLWAALRRRRR